MRCDSFFFWNYELLATQKKKFFPQILGRENLIENDWFYFYVIFSEEYNNEKNKVERRNIWFTCFKVVFTHGRFATGGVKAFFVRSLLQTTKPSFVRLCWKQNLKFKLNIISSGNFLSSLHPLPPTDTKSSVNLA